MKRRLRLGQIEKTRLFSQKEAQWLSGFSRSQLLTWEQAEIVKPEREYAILYTWNQIILLRILYHLRQRWTIHQVIKGFQNSKRSIDEILQMLPKSVVINFGEFGVHPDIYIKITVNNFCNANDIDRQEAKNIFGSEDFTSVNNRGRQTEISVPKIIQEVKALAKEKEVENLDLKLG